MTDQTVQQRSPRFYVGKLDRGEAFHVFDGEALDETGCVAGPFPTKERAQADADWRNGVSMTPLELARRAESLYADGATETADVLVAYRRLADAVLSEAGESR
jgi:hypothetical protein